MKVNLTSNLVPNPLINDAQNKPVKNGFGNLLTEFIKEVNNSQINASNMVNDFIGGKDVQLHEVMIAGEEAKTKLELLMEIRNKSLDMYKELTRMPI